MNKKMFLCAVVDGNVEDLLHNMVCSEHPTVKCVHPPRPCPVFPFREELPTEFNLDINIVELVTIGFNYDVVGRVGRCKKCGKIYYKEVIS